MGEIDDLNMTEDEWRAQVKALGSCSNTETVFADQVLPDLPSPFGFA